MAFYCQELSALVQKVCLECPIETSNYIQFFNPKKFLTIESRNYEQFWSEYCHLLKQKSLGTISGFFNLGEKVDKYLPVIAECVFKFPKSSTIISDDWSKKIILELIFAYQKVMEEVLQIDTKSTGVEFICCVLEMDTDIYDEGDNTKSYYLRLHFPFCRTEQNVIKRLIRGRVIQLLLKRKVMEMFPVTPIGAWEQIISGNTGDNYVPIYGSIVDLQKPVLQLTNIYGMIMEDILDSLEPGDDMDNVELELVDIFDPKNHSYINRGIFTPDGQLFESLGEHPYDPDDVEAYLPLFFSINYMDKCIMVREGININEMRALKNNRTYGTPTPGSAAPIVESDLDMAEKLLLMLSSDRTNNEHYWIDVGKALYNSDKDPDKERAYEIWQDFTERGTERDSESCEDLWETFGVDNALSIKTIAYYARKDSKTSYDEWHKKKYWPYLEKSLNGTHDDIAQAFYQIYWLDFICGSVKNKAWYIFSNHILREADSGREIRIKIGDEFKRYYELLQSEISNKITQTSEDHLKAKHQMDLKKVGDLIRKLKTVTFKSNLMTALLDLFKDDKFEKFANTNVHLMGIDGGIIECCSDRAVVRDGKPEDYVTLQSSVKWNPKLSWNSPSVKKVMTWMGQIFPEEELRTFFLKLIASCIQSKNKYKILPTLTGLGNNSKSMLKKLLELVFGPYSHTFPVHVFTSKNKGGPSPDTALARFAKIAWFTEPPEDAHLQADNLKSHTGIDRIRGRILYSNGDEYECMYTLFLMCNKVPIITGADKAIMNRFRIVPFDSTWDYDAPEDENEQLKLRRFKIDINFETQIPHLTSPTIWILVNMFGELMKKGLKQPSIITKATDKYFSENDLYKKFLEENIEPALIPNSITDENPKGTPDSTVKISITDLYQCFKGWARSNFASMKVPDQPVFSYHMLQRIGKPIKKEYSGIRLRFDGEDVPKI